MPDAGVISGLFRRWLKGHPELLVLRCKRNMLKSMTAYGRASALVGGKDILVEIKSVNNRYFDCTVKISKLYGFLEEKVKNYLQQNGISRGKVDVYVGIDVVENIGLEINLDSAYAGSYINALYKLRDEFGLKDDVSVMRVAQNKDIFTLKKPEEDTEKDWEEVKTVVDSALAEFISMREKEGANLRADLMAKKEGLVAITEKIAAKSAECTAAYGARLEQRLRQVLDTYDIELDSQRILTECAIFADKTAVDEELVRLGSHFKAFDEIMDSDEPVGRKLDFLLQEMNRETNTIGSKANDSEIAHMVVDMKCELEKIREQIQNLE